MRKITKKPLPQGSASLKYNTQIRELVRKFYKKIPHSELAATVTRLTGEVCEPGYLQYLARPERKILRGQGKKGAHVPLRMSVGRPQICGADDVVSREAGKSALDTAMREVGLTPNGEI